MHDFVIYGLYILAGIFAYASAVHWVTGLSHPVNGTRLLLAVISLLSIPLAISLALELKAHDASEYTLALKWTIGLALVLLTLMLWFVVPYWGRNQRGWLFGLTTVAEKRYLRIIAMLSRCDSLLIRATNEQELLNGICKLAVEVGGYLMAWVGFAKNDDAKTVVPVAESGVEEGYLETVKISWADVPLGRGPTGIAIRTGKAVVVQDIHHNPVMSPWQEAAKKRGYNASASLPLTVEGKVIGALNVYSTEPAAFGDDEVRLLEDLSNDLAFGLQSLRVRAEKDDALQRVKRESEKNLALLRNASDGIHILDENGNVIEASEAFCDMLGYRREQIIGMNVSQWEVESEEKCARKANWQKLISRPVHTQYETRYRCSNNKIFDVEVSCFPLELEGKPVLFNSSRDITASKAAVTALRESEEKLRTLYELSPVGIALTDMNGRYIEFNEAFRRICGYSEEELKALDYWVLTPRKYAEAEAQQLHLLRTTGHYGPYEKEYVKKDGSLIPLRLNGVLVTRQDGNQYIWSIVEDISESRRIEGDLRLAATAFESQEGMLITDADMNILRVNGAFTEITGYALPDVTGQNPSVMNSGETHISTYTNMRQSAIDHGVWEGEIWSRKKNGEKYLAHSRLSVVKDPDGQITNFIGSLVDVTHRKQAEDEIHRLAFYDHLTGLPNRRLLMDRMSQAIANSGRNNKFGAVLLIDLDKFKSVNDSVGLAAGNQLLIQASNRLKTCMQEGDTVAHIGGDEFVALLQDLSDDVLLASQLATEFSNKLCATLKDSYQIGNDDYVLTASIGMSLFQGHQVSAEELLRQADIAMYQAKKEGGNTCRLFDHEMQATIDRRMALENEMRSALTKGQFYLAYQAQADKANKLLGAEALIRWKHPERGPISPAEFIPLMEETALIVSAGGWVLDAVCQQLQKWSHHGSTRNLVIAVNVSAKQFHQDDFVAQVASVIERNDINPGLLKVELTETMLLQDIGKTIVTMRALSDMGVRLSLDDFGTGYSSLSYLKKLPLDQIKIDQSFVRDISVDNGALAIVHSIISMADSLGLEVIAEGVETEEQKLLLLHGGCTHFQGYLIGKPLFIDEFEKTFGLSQ